MDVKWRLVCKNEDGERLVFENDESAADYRAAHFGVSFDLEPIKVDFSDFYQPANPAEME